MIPRQRINDRPSRQLQPTGTAKNDRSKLFDIPTYLSTGYGVFEIFGF